MPQHICCWVITPAAPGQTPVYCGKRIVTYKLERDDDGNKVRKYDTLCSEHRAAAAALPVADNDDLED